MAAAVSNKFKMSGTRSTLLWIAMVIGFTIMWQFLNHRPRSRHVDSDSPRHGAGSGMVDEPNSDGRH